jgi:hypothetical protein
MAKLACRWSFGRAASFALTSALIAFGACLHAAAQEGKNQGEGTKKGGPAPKEEGAAAGVLFDAGKARSVVRSGYTRPGNPPDTITEKGTVNHAAFAKDFKGLGGTVYFMVLQLTGKEGDAWGAGFDRFNSAFVPGIDFDQSHSPGLDTRAKYLYLYQVVNDRGMEPLKIRPALNAEIGALPLASATLRLRVDPRYITSWGHFKGVGFAMNAADRTMTGETPPAGLGGEPKAKVVAVSATPSIMEELPEKLFRFRSSAYPLPGLLGLDLATRNLKGLVAVSDLEKKVAAGVPVATWARQLLQAAKTAREPDYVQITLAAPGYWPKVLSRDNEEADDVEEGLATADGREVVFRADWLKTATRDNLLRMGQHSVVFGFTSDLPPINQPIVVSDLAATEQAMANVAGEPIRPAGKEGPGIAPGAAPGVAPGMAPSPAPPPSAAAAPPLPGGGVGGGLLGGLPLMGGMGVGFPGGFGGGAIGTGTPAAITGSGGTGTTGSGTPTTTSTGNNRNNNAVSFAALLNALASAKASTPVNIAINNNVSQRQSQQQSQHQQAQGGHGHVVPEPGAILLGLIGLPGLLLVCWRRRKAALVGA